MRRLTRRRLLELAAIGGAPLVLPRLLFPGLARAEIPAATAKALSDAKLIYVATRRKNGERSEAAPIWFNYADGEIFFTTEPGSWKAKRIAAGSPLYIWVGDEDGPFVIGTAEPVKDPEYVERMGRAYEEKYWIAWTGLFRPRADRVTAGKTAAYRVKLSEGTPPPAARR
jgi:PPOX class probable F420-dependent enzyme